MALIAPPSFVEGSAEPWVVDILCALLKASDQHTVLETGAFVGATTARLAQTLAEMGGGTLVACDIDPQRAEATQARLDQLAAAAVHCRVVADDVLRYVASVPEESIGFVWVDDDHTHAHVEAEIQALLPKMVPNGLLCFHDVWGICELWQEVTRHGGIALDFARLGPAGGLGILQVR